MDTEDKAQEAQQEAEPVTPQSIAEVITELEKYRERLLKDMATVAKKAKMPQSKLKEELEPQLNKIDAALENLRNQHAALTNP
ncbi:MAG: hypothetical protein F6J86_10000 [Symploca sp. SIO1B1]|nr:hypothetical protein [Symploca sp. SIO1C2]NER94153.1 hypothetical protein [Symploca sp. SIO1B1]